jgi:hypothetical protein
MERKVCKFDITDLLPIGLTFVVLGIGLAYGLNVMGDVRGDMTTDTAEYNATVEAIDGVSKLPEKMPLIATVVVAAIIIGILVRYLMVRFT